MKFVLVLCLASAAFAADEKKPNVVATGGNNAPAWTYADEASWGDKCATPGVQSPINVPKEVEEKAFRARKALFYNGNYTMILTNNGRNLRMTYICCETPYVAGGSIPDDEKYYMMYVNFYFGADSSTGSAHTIDGKSYPLEVVVHSSKLADEKSKDQRAVAVSLFYEETEEDVECMKPFIEAVSKVKKFDQVSDFKTNNLLSMFIPEKVQKTYANDYFTYEGSTMTPPCHEPVTYFLIRTPLKIGKNQLKVLRELEDENGKPIAGNRRPAQDLGERKVYQSKPKEVINW